QHKAVKLPLVLYFNKGKEAGRTRVARSANPTYPPPTTSKTLFDYTGNYQKWNFNFVDKHPIEMQWGHPQPFLKPADNAQQAAPAQPGNDAAQAAPAQQQQQPEQQAAYPAQQQQSAFQPQTATPQQNTQLNPNNPLLRYLATKMSQPSESLPKLSNLVTDQGKNVYISVPQQNETTGGYSANAPLNDQPTKQNDKLIQSYNYGKPVKVPCPKGLECNYDGPSAPQINETFILYCDDKFPNCGVMKSSCNESWLQIYCQKRCNLCKPQDIQTNAVEAPATSNQDAAQYDNKVYPSKVSEINDDTVNIESELVAPEPSDKPQRARYTLHVTPKLKNGVPQQQEIFIMPPNAKPGSNVKPLVILKQKVTRPMIENIEIDVPPKGIEYSDEPKVEVIEGANHETLKVSEGQADISKAEADLAKKNAAEQLAQAPAAQAPAQADQTAPAATPAAAPVAAAPAPAQLLPLQLQLLPQLLPLQLQLLPQLLPLQLQPLPQQAQKQHSTMPSPNSPTQRPRLLRLRAIKITLRPRLLQIKLLRPQIISNRLPKPTIRLNKPLLQRQRQHKLQQQHPLLHQLHTQHRTPNKLTKPNNVLTIHVVRHTIKTCVHKTGYKRTVRTCAISAK
ncbi:hypothetical protein QZH41_017783, partial [Actinostola sp. cb2023]